MSRSCATHPRPRRARRCGARRLMSSPRQRIDPRRSWVKPMTVRKRVVLPAPLRPRSATLSPALISRETLSSTIELPYPARTPSRTSRGSDMAALAEIELAHLRIAGDFGRASFHEDAAGHHHDDAARNAEHATPVVLD